MRYFKTVKLYNTPLLDKIRIAARKEKWSTVAGFKEWARETYNATMRSGEAGDITSISFYKEPDYERFQKDFE
jgi:hypothetical protein